MAITLGANNAKQLIITVTRNHDKKDIDYNSTEYIMLQLLSIGGMYILVATKNPKDVFKNFSII